MKSSVCCSADRHIYMLQIDLSEVLPPSHRAAHEGILRMCLANARARVKDREGTSQHVLTTWPRNCTTAVLGFVSAEARLPLWYEHLLGNICNSVGKLVWQ